MLAHPVQVGYLDVELASDLLLRPSLIECLTDGLAADNSQPLGLRMAVPQEGVSDERSFSRIGDRQDIGERRHEWMVPPLCLVGKSELSSCEPAVAPGTVRAADRQPPAVGTVTLRTSNRARHGPRRRPSDIARQRSSANRRRFEVWRVRR